MTSGQFGEGLFAGALLLSGGAVGDRLALAENSGAVHDAHVLAVDLADAVHDTPDGRFYGDKGLTVLRVIATADSLTIEGPVQVSKAGDTVTVSGDLSTAKLSELAADNVADAESKQNKQRWLYRAIGSSAFFAIGQGLRSAGRKIF